MSPQIKDKLGYAIIVSVLALGLAALWHASAYSRSTEPLGVRTFTVSGDGQAVVIPDVAQLSFHVLTEGGQDIGALQKKNTDAMNAILSFIKDQKVDTKDIKTSAYSVTPRYQYATCGALLGGATNVCPPPSIVGYSIDQGVEIKVRDFQKIGALLAGVVQRGANNVSGPNFTLDDPTSAENLARADAIEKAQSKARAIASAGGFQLGRIITVEEGNQPQPIYTMEAGYANAGPMKAALPTIEAGSQQVNITITLRYEID